MQELEFTAGRFGQIWWAIAWRGTAAFLVSALFFSGVGGLVLALMKSLLHTSVEDTQQITHFMGFLILVGGGVVASVLAPRMALRKRYKDFRIVLVGPD